MRRPPTEPVLWLLFSAGGVASALFLPVLIFLFGVAFPLGWITPPDYADIHGLLRNPLVALVLAGVFVLSLFHWAHRFRYTLDDGLQIKHLGLPINVLCYGGAVVGSLATLYVMVKVL